MSNSSSLVRDGLSLPTAAVYSHLKNLELRERQQRIILVRIEAARTELETQIQIASNTQLAIDYLSQRRYAILLIATYKTLCAFFMNRGNFPSLTDLANTQGISVSAVDKRLRRLVIAGLIEKTRWDLGHIKLVNITQISKGEDRGSITVDRMD